MRILLVAPGPLLSTYDVFHYYRDAMEANDEVQVYPFDYHSIMMWQRLAVNVWTENSVDEEHAIKMGASRAARELLADIMIFQPDVIMVVSGTLLPHFVWKYIVHIRSQLKTKYAIALYLTECPYLDELQLEYLQYADVLFVNDKVSLDEFDPDSEKHIYYLPHSYNPAVHRPMNESDDYDKKEYESDVFFVGTPFIERGEFLASVDWDEVNFKLGGDWVDYSKPEDYLKLHPHIIGNRIKNEATSRFYANSKISLNIHRTRTGIDMYGDTLDNYVDAYSVGPRPYEVVACGSFLATDFRQEAKDMFGDSIGYFDTQDDLSKLMKEVLSNDSQRKERILEAQDKIKDCTFKNRLDNIILPVFDEVLRLR